MIFFGAFLDFFQEICLVRYGQRPNAVGGGGGGGGSGDSGRMSIKMMPWKRYKSFIGTKRYEKFIGTKMDLGCPPKKSFGFDSRSNLQP